MRSSPSALNTLPKRKGSSSFYQNIKKDTHKAMTAKAYKYQDHHCLLTTHRTMRRALLIVPCLAILPPVSATHLPARTLHIRQEPTPIPTPTPTSNLFPTIIASSSSTSTEPILTEAPIPSPSTTGEPHEYITTTRLDVADKPIPLAGTVGLIMPNPYDELFVGGSRRCLI